MPSHIKPTSSRKSEAKKSVQGSSVSFKTKQSAPLSKVAPHKSSWTQAALSRQALEANLTGLFSQLGCA
jgi:hypothetical protein